MLLYCKSLNCEVLLEKRRQNFLLLKSIEVKTDASICDKYLSVTYPLICDPLVVFLPSKSNYAAAKQNSIRFRAKLLKIDLLASFNEQLQSDIDKKNL